MIEEGSLFSITCWEQSSLPKPSCCDLPPTQQKNLTSVLFLVSPLGQRHHKVDWWVLIIYWGTTLSEGNQRVATQKLMDGAQLPTLHGDTFLFFSGCGYFNFQRARSCCFDLHTIKYLSPESRGSQSPHYFDGFNLSEHWSKRKILWWL